MARKRRRSMMLSQNDEVVMVSINELVKIEDQELNPGDSIVCDIPESFEPGDLAVAQVTEDGLLIVARVMQYNLLRGPAKRDYVSGSKQRT